MAAAFIPQHPSSAGSRTGELHFLDESRPQSFKATLGNMVVSHAAVLMAAVWISTLDCFEYHKKDLKQQVIKRLIVFPTNINFPPRIPDQETTFCFHFSCQRHERSNSFFTLNLCRALLAGFCDVLQMQRMKRCQCISHFPSGSLPPLVSHPAKVSPTARPWQRCS